MHTIKVHDMGEFIKSNEWQVHIFIPSIYYSKQLLPFNPIVSGILEINSFVFPVGMLNSKPNLKTWNVELNIKNQLDGGIFHKIEQLIIELKQEDNAFRNICLSPHTDR